MCPGGSAGAPCGEQTQVYDQSGTLFGTWAIAGTAVEDMAVDGIHNLVIATGWTQVGGNLQLPFIRAGITAENSNGGAMILTRHPVWELTHAVPSYRWGVTTNSTLPEQSMEAQAYLFSHVIQKILT